MTNNSLSKKELVFSIDIGTTSLKAAFVSALGEVFSFKRIEYSSLPIFSSEKNASGLWLEALKKILPDPLLDDCAALCVSGNGPTIVSDSGKSLLWNESAEFFQAQDFSQEESSGLFEKIELPDAQKKIYEPRLFAFRKKFPEEWKAAKKLFPAPEWLCFYLEKNRAAFGLGQDILIYPSGPDFIAALIGSGTLFPGRLCDRAGSSEGLNLCSSKAVQDKNLRTMPSPAKGLWNISCLISDPGKSSLEKLDKLSKAYKTLKAAAAANDLDFDDTIVVSGGQAMDQNLLQQKADALNSKIALVQIPDAELLGDAAAAFTRLGRYETLQEAVKKIVRVTKTFYPAAASLSCGKSKADECQAFPRFYNIPAGLKAIIFDIDSTLYTNAGYAFEQVDCQVRRFASLRGISNEEARKMVADYRKKFAQENGGKKVSLSNTLLSFGISIEQSVQWRRELIEPGEFLSPDKKLRETLALLSKKFKLLCVTNNPILPAQKTLKALGVEEWISSLIGLDTCNLSKPAKEPFILAAKEADLPFDKIASVGDRYDLDLAPALELGMGGILVSGVADVYKLPSLL